MGDSFKIQLYFPDGDPPETGERDAADLSQRWLDQCSEILNYFGPVFNHNMGSTLSHFDIRMAGPMVELLANNNTCFRLAILCGTGTEQEHATKDQFASLLNRVVSAVENDVAPETIESMGIENKTRMLLALDLLADVPEDQKQALFQLGEHLAWAYIQYCEESTE